MRFFKNILLNCHLPLFLLGSGLHLRDVGISSSQIKLIHALVDEIFKRDSAGSGFKLCAITPLISVVMSDDAYYATALPHQTTPPLNPDEHFSTWQLVLFQVLVYIIPSLLEICTIKTLFQSFQQHKIGALKMAALNGDRVKSGRTKRGSDCTS